MRQAIAAKGALAVIPNNLSRALKSARQTSLYPAPSRRMLLFKAQVVPTRSNRFEKTARNYLAVVTLAAIVLWMR
jgi:hypothetical protein